MTEKFRLSLGASYRGRGRTTFRVWAPKRKTVEVALETRGTLELHPLERGNDGYFAGEHDAHPGTRYRFRLDGRDSFPDPCSRYQPQGPHGPSEIVDPGRFAWSDDQWKGLSPKGQVVYELHVGTYTPEGRYLSLIPHLPALRDLGITAIELMPVHTFPGRFNWGYDGVAMFAPCAVYGTPDELRKLVDEGHRVGLGMILDVVHNHLGPDGNYLRQFSDSYFTDRYSTEWGEPINYDGENAGPVRDFFLQNACYWIAEYHFDGLRLDATQNIYDHSPRHILADLSEKTRAAAGNREIVLFAESDAQEILLVTPLSEGGRGLDAIWVDDFHHTTRVAITGTAEAFCSDYAGDAQELLACALFNGLYQGQWYGWLKRLRGTPLWGASAGQILFFLQNHDQIANHLHGPRLHQLAGDALARALTTYFLLLPQTPLLFMGQEFFASSPFLYFTDHAADLQSKVKSGREEFLCLFPSARRQLEVEGVHPPSGEEAFRASRLRLEEREQHVGALTLHRELLRLRREDPVISRATSNSIRGETLGPNALVLRFPGDRTLSDRLLVLNLKGPVELEHCPYPLLSAAGSRWLPVISSDDRRFGGRGAPLPSGEGPWTLPGQSAFLLRLGDG